MAIVHVDRPSFPTAVLALAITLAGCHDRDAEPAAIVPAAPPPPVAAVLPATPRALLRVSSQDDGSPSPRLYAVAADGAVRAVEFRDAEGRPVAAAVAEYGALTREWAWVRLTWGRAADGLPYVRQALLRIADGKLVEADGLSMYHAQVKGGTLYAYRAYQPALTRIDLASMAAAPVNDPTSDPLGAWFLVDHQGNVRASVRRGSGPVETRIFPAAGTPPFVDPWQPGSFAHDLCDRGSPPFVTTYGEDGHVYAVCTAAFPDPEASTSTATYVGTFVREVSFTPTGTQVVDAAPVREPACGAGCFKAPIAATHAAHRFDQRARFLPDTTGFLGTRPVAGGGISLAWTDLALPRRLTLIAGDHAYWQRDGAISRIRLAAGATPETVVTDPQLQSWTVAGGVVVFTRATGGVKTGTYAVTDPGLEPTLISSSAQDLWEVEEL